MSLKSFTVFSSIFRVFKAQFKTSLKRFEVQTHLQNTLEHGAATASTPPVLPTLEIRIVGMDKPRFEARPRCKSFTLCFRSAI